VSNDDFIRSEVEAKAIRRRKKEERRDARILKGISSSTSTASLKKLSSTAGIVPSSIDLTSIDNLALIVY